MTHQKFKDASRQLVMCFFFASSQREILSQQKDIHTNEGPEIRNITVQFSILVPNDFYVFSNLKERRNYICF